MSWKKWGNVQTLILLAELTSLRSSFGFLRGCLLKLKFWRGECRFSSAAGDELLKLRWLLDHCLNSGAKKSLGCQEEKLFPSPWAPKGYALGASPYGCHGSNRAAHRTSRLLGFPEGKICHTTELKDCVMKSHPQGCRNGNKIACKCIFDPGHPRIAVFSKPLHVSINIC